MAIFISEENRFSVKICHKTHKKSLYNEKRSLNHKDITIINIYAPQNGGPRYIKQTLKTEKRKIQQYNNTRKLQYLVFKNE